jgi:DNA polymerase-3 subunit delta'
LAGPADIGKSQLALALARLLLCAAPSAGLNCGECHACQLSARGSHGDLRWLQPEDKSRVIKIDQVRAAVEFANQTANFGLRKVLVLCPADSMNTNAANALLKSLEEPAPGTYLILCCDRLHGVPATIRSRCQIVKLAQPSQAASIAWLDALTGSAEQSSRLLQIADGRPLLAEQLYREDSAEALAAIRAALAGVLTGKLSAHEVVNLLSDTGTEAFLAHLQAELQSLLRVQSGQSLGTPGAKAAFSLSDEVNRLQRAVAAGANPNG